MTGIRFGASQYFNPRHLPSLACWYDASDVNANSSNPSDGTALSSWKDKSRNANNASQGTGASQPLFKTNIANGLPGILFDGSNDFMSGATSGTMGITSSPYEIYVVASSSSSAFQFITSCATAGRFEISLNVLVGASFLPNSTSTPITTDIGTASQYTDGVPHIFSGRVESDASNTFYVRVDSTDGGSPVASGLSSTNNNFIMGYRGNVSFPFSGYIFELVVCATQLRAEQRTALATYFKRWGI